MLWSFLRGRWALSATSCREALREQPASWCTCPRAWQFSCCSSREARGDWAIHHLLLSVRCRGRYGDLASHVAHYALLRSFGCCRGCGYCPPVRTWCTSSLQTSLWPSLHSTPLLHSSTIGSFGIKRLCECCRGQREAIVPSPLRQDLGNPSKTCSSFSSRNRIVPHRFVGPV